MAAEGSTQRDASFDVLKGVCILAVVTLHSTGFAARRFFEQWSPEWWFINAVNRFLALGVPTFLMVSAILLARSMSRDGSSWKRFYSRRATGVLWPYLVWTVLYWLFKYYVSDAAASQRVINYQTPFGVLHGPALWVNLHDRMRDVLLGKAHFHLYFLAILLGLICCFPILIAAMRRMRVGFGLVCLVGIIAQSAMLLLQKFCLHATYPATYFTWYLMILLPGIWLGLNWKKWDAIWDAYHFAILLTFLVSFCWFMALAMQVIAGANVNGLLMNGSEKLFTMASALLLLGLCTSVPNTSKPLPRVLAALGRASLQIYLVHPMLLFFLKGPRISERLAQLPLTTPTLIILVTGISFIFAILVSFAGLQVPLFGLSGLPLVPSVWSFFRKKPASPG